MERRRSDAERRNQEEHTGQRRVEILWLHQCNNKNVFKNMISTCISYSECSRRSRLCPSPLNQTYQTSVPLRLHCGDDLIGLADLDARVVFGVNRRAAAS